MSENKLLQVFNLSPEELKEQTNSAIEAAFLKHADKFRPKEKTNYLTRKEVAAIFKISLVTVNDWNNLGILKPYRLGRLVRYKSDEIEAALTRIHPEK
jgi:predicted DNA-binding transcriptional regulator AlpA